MIRRRPPSPPAGEAGHQEGGEGWRTVAVPTAWHEAGHAVTATALARPIAEVTILPGPRSLGHVGYADGGWPPDQPPASSWLAEAVSTAAGSLAEGGPALARRVLWGRPHPDTDEARLKDLAYAHGASIPRLLALAERVVAHHGPAIEAVAEALLERHRLGPEDLRTLGVGVCEECCALVAGSV